MSDSEDRFGVSIGSAGDAQGEEANAARPSSAAENQDADFLPPQVGDMEELELADSAFLPPEPVYRGGRASQSEELELGEPLAPSRAQALRGSPSHGSSGSFRQQNAKLELDVWRLTRLPVIAILLWFTLSHVFFGSEWVFIDGANLLFHEAGHILFSWGGDTIATLGGTFGQLMWPIGLAFYFALKRKERFPTVVCVWWAGENLVNIARYMKDAPVQELPLVGGGRHDWNHLFGKWGMIREAPGVADKVRLGGVVIMLVTLAALAWMSFRPTDDELAAGGRAE